MQALTARLTRADDTGLNAYDTRKRGDYIEDQLVEDFLNSHEARQLWGLTEELKHDKYAPRKFSECSDVVGQQFAQTGDGGKSSVEQIQFLLEHGVRALIYAGDKDFICNWVRTQALPL